MSVIGENAPRVGVAGLGAIGMTVARRLDEGIAGLVLTAVSARDRDRARRRVEAFKTAVSVVAPEDLAGAADIVVECTPAAVFLRVAEPAIRAGRILVPVSVAALLSHHHLIDLAAECGARIVVPSGALLGLDAVRAAAEGDVASITMVTRKPPSALAGAPYVEEHGIRLDGLERPLKLFEGSAGEGAKGFPANLNVAAALSLAGIGPERTRLEIWADPGVDRNVHHIEVRADSASFDMNIENVPSPDNPRTGRLAALSVIATLRGLVSPLRVGT